MIKIEIRKCPDGHVSYRIGDTFFIGKPWNSDKHYCPVCSKRLITKLYNEVEIDWCRNMTKKESEKYKKSLNKLYKTTGINLFELGE